MVYEKLLDNRKFCDLGCSSQFKCFIWAHNVQTKAQDKLQDAASRPGASWKQAGRCVACLVFQSRFVWGGHSHVEAVRSFCAPGRNRCIGTDRLDSCPNNIRTHHWRHHGFKRRSDTRRTGSPHESGYRSAANSRHRQWRPLLCPGFAARRL
jgi:hypothetical protein